MFSKGDIFYSILFTCSFECSHLQQQIVNGRLHLQCEAVTGIILAERELVINAEGRHGRHGSTGLRRLLVLLSSLQNFDLQLFQLCPKDQTEYMDMFSTFTI